MNINFWGVLIGTIVGVASFFCTLGLLDALLSQNGSEQKYVVAWLIVIAMVAALDLSERIRDERQED